MMDNTKKKKRKPSPQKLSKSPHAVRAVSSKCAPTYCAVVCYFLALSIRKTQRGVDMLANLKSAKASKISSRFSLLPPPFLFSASIILVIAIERDV